MRVEEGTVVAPRLGAPGLLVDGRYRLRALLGAGGFGEVWEAVHEVEGAAVRPLALKLLTAGTEAGPGAAAPDAGASPGATDRWLDEVRAVRDLRCQSVVTIFDVGVAREARLPFIAMELLHGRTLEAYLEGRALPWRRALGIGREVTAALVACHRVGVSHCDLKPQNVFIADDGRVCVLDFGVAALGAGAATPPRPRRPPPAAVDALGATGAVTLDEVPGATPLERPRRAFGTPGYMPPEGLAGEPAGPAGDAFALGMLLYRALAGRLPHRLPAGIVLPDRSAGREGLDRYRTALNAATVRGDFLPLGEAAPATPPAVIAVIDDLLQLDPARRPTADLAARLDEAWRRPFGLPASPYVGLEAFDERRAGFIAGRDADIRTVTDRLRERRAVVLCGPSGCGKSSLAAAGITARVDEEMLLGQDGWVPLILRPSEGRSALAVAASGGPGAPLGRGVIVVVDQLEELLTLDPTERGAVAAALAALATGTAAVTVRGQRLAPDQPVRLVATVRDDLFGQVAALPELERFPEQNLYTVRGVEPNAVPEIVVGPAHAAGFTVEGADEVCAEARRILDGDPSALPLVQFALTRWWEERDLAGRSLTRAGWQRIGGIEGALAEAAQELYDGLGSGGQQAMRALLLLLFREDGTRNRIDQSQLTDEALGPDLPLVLERLVERRLVRRRLDGRGLPILEVVHEALARRWSRLAQWLQETQAERELAAAARLDAGRWERAGRPADMLWRGARLTQARALGPRLGVAAGFVAAAAHAQRRQAWTRRALVGLVGGLVLLAAILVLSFGASNRERKTAVQALERIEGLRQRALAEAARAEREKKSADQERAQAQRERAEADKQRQEADRQRQQAEAQRLETERQRLEAERQRLEAERLAKLADEEKLKAQAAERRAHDDAEKLRVAEKRRAELEAQLKGKIVREGVGEPNYP